MGALSGSYKGAVAPVGEGKDATAFLIGGPDNAIKLLPANSKDEKVNLSGVIAELRLKTVKA